MMGVAVWHAEAGLGREGSRMLCLLSSALFPVQQPHLDAESQGDVRRMQQVWELPHFPTSKVAMSTFLLGHNLWSALSSYLGPIREGREPGRSFIWG